MRFVNATASPLLLNTKALCFSNNNEKRYCKYSRLYLTYTKYGIDRSSRWSNTWHWLTLVNKYRHHTSQSSNNNKYGRSTSKTTTVSSVHSEEPTPPPSTGKRYQSRRNKQSRSSTSTPTPENNNGYTRRGFKPKVQPTAAEQPSASSSLYKFKLNRSPGRYM